MIVQFDTTDNPQFCYLVSAKFTKQRKKNVLIKHDTEWVEPINSAAKSSQFTASVWAELSDGLHV